MKDLYRNTAGALRYVIELGGPCSLGALHLHVTAADALTGDDAMLQSARIRAALDCLSPLERALLFVTYAPRSIVCNCGAACCARHKPNLEYATALALLGGHIYNGAARSAIVENVLRRIKETKISLAQRCGTHRSTVAEHYGIVEVSLGFQGMTGSRPFTRPECYLCLREPVTYV